MKIATSYFYQIRFFTPNMIPFSTAVWDPKWYHFNQGQHIYGKDKRGVYNGLRIPPLAPKNVGCSGPKGCPHSPSNCSFMKLYREQLNKLDCHEIVSRLYKNLETIQQFEGFTDEPIAVLIVHEAPSNPCSERSVIQEWFQNNGYAVQELLYPIQGSIK